ncbi:hypothetical protein LA20533_04855 [Amylolactobacillus amylophilus DSM 20533 = JCM 1125]|uniref:Immunity protein n=1 Tax=Amylolactobacillus amylophilus DSM 20533 = JCM 1125 TaxID=1423721 RepID=A0A1L6XCC9_9LACO|nr:hypothetical protein LA20533_04855 [Amylolactobacillus amylophilus DSM 20533 = JCM 1125]
MIHRVVTSAIVAVWQFYNTYSEFMRIKTHGNKNTSAFAGYGIWYSAFFGVIMLSLSIAAFTGAFK